MKPARGAMRLLLHRSALLKSVCLDRLTGSQQTKCWQEAIRTEEGPKDMQQFRRGLGDVRNKRQ